MIRAYAPNRSTDVGFILRETVMLGCAETVVGHGRRVPLLATDAGSAKVGAVLRAVPAGRPRSSVDARRQQKHETCLP